MNCRQKNHIKNVQVAQYASGNDFCRLFAEKMDSLYWLAFLLTGDQEKAEQSFVAGWKTAFRRIGCSSPGHTPGLNGRLFRTRFIC